MEDLIKTLVVAKAMDGDKKAPDGVAEYTKKENERRENARRDKELKEARATGERNLNNQIAQQKKREIIINEERDKQEAMSLQRERLRMLSKPLKEQAKMNPDRRKEYNEQQAIMAEFIINNKALAELAECYAEQLNKSQEDLEKDFEVSRDAVLEGESAFENNVEEEVVDILLENAIEEQKTQEVRVNHWKKLKGR